ncbi:hypothetical protein [Granulicella mallensis]|uniref:Uncharacterized protein n=1 Tax=Granulicella mallensis TaxID=940614 RepID=A0A7W7ZV57_9BACT|nr:hypothetical protein [Granulicella mallensis]MBB5066750.1 hypothetical protein [Granulicella mallensis]
MTNKLYLFAPRGRRTTRACFRSLAKSMLTYAVVCGFYSQSPVWASEKPLPMQTPTAQSVGTSTNLKSAAQVLLSHFEELKKHKKDWITEDDLQSLVESPDPVVREAVRFFAVSPIDRELCGEAQGMTKAGLARCIPVAGSAGLEETLLRLGHATGDVKDEAQRKFYATLLRDPGVPAVVRAQIVARLSEKDMLAIVGHPNTQGNAKDVADETAAFLFLAKMSWLGTAEAEAVAAYKVPYVMLRGDKDHSASFWDGHQVHLSEKMLTGGTGVVSDQTLVKHIGTFAHESGHAIFGFSGLSKTVGDDIARRHLENGVGVIINEAVAGIMQNRAHVAELGYGADKGSDANLSVAHDVEKNIANDQTDYARRYHVNTAVARSQMDDIRKVLANSVVPYFQSKFGLLGDPQLTLTLPDPQR